MCPGTSYWKTGQRCRSKNAKHCMDKRMLNDTESLIYDVRNDHDKQRYAFDGLVPKEELDELNAENDRLHDRILDLEQELDENT